MLIPIPPNVDPNLRVFLQGLAEQVQIGAGQRGDSLDKNVTWGDLLRANIAEVSPTSGFVNPLYRENPPGEGSGTPPSVKEVSVDGSLGSYLVTFALPTQPSAAWSHAEIWGYEYDGLATTPDKAVLLGVSATGVYTFDPTRDGSEDSWVFFVRFVRGEEYGPWHDNAGVVASRPITPQKFYEQSIAGLGIDDLQQATADNALAIQQQGGTLSDHAQLIADNANSLGNITFGNLNPLPNTAAVDLLTNGSGLFLNAQGETVFAAAADKFALYTPSITDLGELELNTPFFVSGGQTYIKSAFIEEATIQNAVTGSLISDRIVADNVSFEAAQIADGAITNAKIAGTLQSDSFSSSTGWKLEQNGKFTCVNGRFNGVLEAPILQGATRVKASTSEAKGSATYSYSPTYAWPGGAYIFSTSVEVALMYGPAYGDNPGKEDSTLVNNSGILLIDLFFETTRNVSADDSLLEGEIVFRAEFSGGTTVTRKLASYIPPVITNNSRSGNFDHFKQRHYVGMVPLFGAGGVFSGYDISALVRLRILGVHINGSSTFICYQYKGFMTYNNL